MTFTQDSQHSSLLNQVFLPAQRDLLELSSSGSRPGSCRSSSPPPASRTSASWTVRAPAARAVATRSMMVMMMALMNVAPMDTCMSYGVTMVRRTKADRWMAGAKQ